MRKIFILLAFAPLAFSFGCIQAPSVVRDSATQDEELYLQQVQQTVEAEEREHQQQIVAKQTGG